MVCVEKGEGGHFYSPNRSVPALNKYGNIVHRLGVDQDDLPAKVEVDWRQSGAGCNTLNFKSGTQKNLISFVIGR